MKLKTLAVAVALGVAGQANAAIDDQVANGFDNVGGSELVLTVFDTANGDSYSRDLGVAFNSIIGAGSMSWSADATLAGMLSSDNLIWNVTAIDYNEDGSDVDADSNWGYRLLTTSTVVDPAAPTDFGLSQAAAKLNTMVNALNTTAGHTSEADGSQIVNGIAGSWASVGSTMGSNLPFSVDGSIDEALTFSLLSENLDVNGGRRTTKDFLSIDVLEIGSFSLNGSGELSFAAPAPVPVPAAVWLMGSALAGLVGLRRRKST